MIYLDSSVALAHILNDPHRPPKTFWTPEMTSSRLLEFEVQARLNAGGASTDRRTIARELLEAVPLIEMTRSALARALRPFPLPVRTLDGLHLATMDHLRGRGLSLTLASYDKRLLAVAEALGFPTFQP